VLVFIMRIYPHSYPAEFRITLSIHSHLAIVFLNRFSCSTPRNGL